MQTFESAKVGDRVWSFMEGWGTVKGNDCESIYVRFDSGTSWNFTLSGAFLGGGEKNPVLFWSEIKFEIPPKPKVKVKKTVEGQIKIYKDGAIGFHETDVDSSFGDARVVLKTNATITYEIEE